MRAAGLARACARTPVPRQARGAAYYRRKSTLDPHHRPDHTQARAIEIAILDRDLSRVLKESQQRVVLIAVDTRVEGIPGCRGGKLIEFSLAIPF